ncbi:TonB-dependent receptor plug domain-containing protein [Sphingobium sufflavum]|uniref:TonB-dependent receptor n=1 Tax=Sphingobium sufflavum TaxID=1129547 RepID=UPI001F25DC20|nr:TonB-dependent receptor plug domain-containing protein [Sphingobium sufflavum]MCE7796216.1 TonB-dependent receptor plug domain-containing protein [Sphingobium sufflavum]
MNAHSLSRAFWLAGAGLLSLAISAPAFSQTAAPADDSAAEADAPHGDAATIVVTGVKATRSATAIPAAEIQKILPGVAPFKAIQTLPGVMYVTADPWGNNEQNASLFIHGFSAQQLGHTLDGVPLGDQSYGNFNGLSPQRAIISENVGSVVVATGAAELGIAATSNLGGAIENFSSDPRKERSVQINHTAGSYGTARTFVRVDSGEFGSGNSGYVSVVRQRARAWDFNGRQGGWAANAKFVHDDSNGKLSAYFAYSDKQEPNEDATVVYKTPANAAQAYQPYVRPFFYPDFNAAVAYLDASGNVPSAESQNYRNFYSAALRTDYLGYIKYQAHLTDAIDWSNQVYYHHNDGAGIVAGPITVASLPTLFALYFPGQNLKAATGNSGYAIRTTEYRIDRGGMISTLDVHLGDHTIQAGAWYEYNSSAAYRRWYGLDVTRPQDYSPYAVPSNPLFTQYGSEMRTNTVQFHVQDAWQVTPSLLVQGGFKSSLQFASGNFTVQPIIGSLAGSSSALPNGEINTKRWFLPAIGAKWDVTGSEQLYVNVQKNLRHFQPYGAGGVTPWSTGSQAAFDNLKNYGRPETAWTYEIGFRTRRTIDSSFLTGIEAQVNYYHVDFRNRLLGITAAVGGIGGGSISGGTPAVFNVGSVKTDGVDAAVTFRFGSIFSLYNALSYNNSRYDSDYSTVTGQATGTRIGGIATVGGVVPTGGKQVPVSPKWMNKTVATLTLGDFDAQVIGDYVGRRFTTFTNDASVKRVFQASARIGYRLPTEFIGLAVQKAEISLNVSNLFDVTGASTVQASSNTNSFNAYPIPPRQWFGTLSVTF